MIKMVIKITLDGEDSVYEVQGVENEEEIIAQFIKCDLRFLDDAKFELIYKDLKFDESVTIEDVICIQDIINMHDLDLNIIDKSLDGAYKIDDSIVRKIVTEGYFAKTNADTIDEAIIELAKGYYDYEIAELPPSLRDAIDWVKVGKSYTSFMTVVESSYQKRTWFLLNKHIW